MSTNVLLRPGGQTIVGGLDIFVAPARTVMPVIDVPVENAGSQGLIYGAAANAAGVDAAIQAQTPEIGFGRGADLTLPVSNPGSAAWVAYVAVTEDLASLPTSDLSGAFTKRVATVDVNNVSYTVYTANGTSSEDAANINVVFGGSSPWSRLGSQESCDISESGVTVAAEQTYTEVRCLGRTAPSKITRNTTDLVVSFEINDLSVETMALIMDRANIVHSANAGGVGWRRMGLARPVEMAQYALVARGDGLSSYLEGGNLQFWCPVMVQTGSPASVWTKSAAAALSVEFRAIDDRAQGAVDGLGLYVHEDRDRNAA